MTRDRHEAPTEAGESGHTRTVAAGNAATVPDVGPPTDRSPAAGGSPRGSLPTIDPAHYTMLEEVARGGMGRIRAAIDRRLGRQVAIKELLRPDPVLAARFEREALITSRLQHPSIVGVYEAGRWPGGEPFYAMKLVRGRSLKQVIAEAATLDARLALLPHVLAVADAIAYAHDLRIIHRDLKPSNVLVGTFGETVVLDWGLVKDLDATDVEEASAPARDSAAELTAAGSVIGTPNYMPPEQASGAPVDERADVYALGAMLYHVLAGEPPYRGQRSAEVFAQLASGPPRPLRTIASGAPADLVAIVERAMARAREDRYPSARELAEDLRRFTTGQLVASHRYTRRHLLARFVRRHRLPLGIAALAVVCIAAIGAVAIDRVVDERDDANRERATARARADELLVMQAARLVEDDPRQALALLGELSPGSPRLADARVIASDVRARGLGHELRGHAGPILDLAVSDDGRWAVTGGEDRTVRLWDLTRLEGRVLGAHELAVRGVAISRDGAHVASTSLDRTVRVWDVRSGAATTLEHATPVLGFPVLAPDGRRIVTFPTRGDAQLWDVEHRRVIATLAGVRRVVMRDARRALVFARRDRGPELDAGLLELDTGATRMLEDGPPWASFAIAAGAGAVAWVGEDRAIRRLDVATGARTELGRVRSPRCQLGITRDGRHLATLCAGALARWVDGEARPIHTDPLPARFSPQLSSDGTRILVGVEGYTDPPTLHAVLAGTRPFRTRRLVVTEPSRGWQLTHDGRLVVAAAGSSLWAWPVADASRVVAGHRTDLDPTSARALLQGGARLETVRQVSVLRDGRVLSAGADGELRLEGRPAPLRVGRYRGRIAVAPDERSLAVLGVDGTLRVVDLASGAVRALAGRVDVTVRDRPADPRDRVLERAHGTLDDVLVARDTRSMREHLELIDYLAYAADASWLAAAEPRGGRLHLWTLPGGEHRRLELGAADIEDLASLPGGRLAVACSDGTIHLVTPATGQQLALPGHAGPIEDLAVSRTGVLASAGMDGAILLWDLAALRPRRLARARGGVVRIALSPDATTLVAASEDRTVGVWDVASATRRELVALPRAILALALSGDGGTVALASIAGPRVCDLASARCRVLDDQGALDVAVSARGDAIAGGLRRGHVVVWPDDLPRDEPGLRAWLAHPVP